MTTPGIFVTSPGTSEGKTFVTRGLAAALRRTQRNPIALKPLETGVIDYAADAHALARAAGGADPFEHRAFFRSSLAVAPYAAVLERAASPIILSSVVAAVRTLASAADFALIEGAGGLLVPLTATQTIADLALALRYPLLIVAADRLGVLSSVLTCVESAAQRRLPVGAVVLVAHPPNASDPSPRTNRRILVERLATPVLGFPCCDDDDDALAHAAMNSGLLELVTSLRPATGPNSEP